LKADDLQHSEQFYQAIGTVEGTFLPGEPESQGELVIDGQHYPTWIRFSLLKYLRPGEVQRFRVYPHYFKAQQQWTFTVKFIDNLLKYLPNEFTLRGNWCQRQGTLLLQVRQIRREGKPFYLPLQWPGAPEPADEFWVLKCQFTGKVMVVQQAEGPYSPPPSLQQPSASLLLPSDQPSSKRVQAPTVATAQPYPSRPIAEVKAMAIPAKVEITCKFSQVPPAREVAGGVEFYLAEGNYLLTVRVKPKQFNKLVNHGYTDWIAAVTGQLGAATETGFELANANIQVFERKPKPSQTPAEASSTAADAPASTAKPNPAPPARPQERPEPKGLLKHIQVR